MQNKASFIGKFMITSKEKECSGEAVPILVIFDLITAGESISLPRTEIFSKSRLETVGNFDIYIWLSYGYP